MIRAAQRAGFSSEGVLRQAGWVLGSFVDTVVMGRLAREWESTGAGQPPGNQTA